jgi:hypothetical protein
MRIPRSRGAVSGLLLMILGAWGALVPFIGPYFDVVIGPDDTWNWSSDRFWLSVVPGIVAFVGGLILLQSAHRGGAGLGAWMGILAGAWFVLGPLISRLWTSDGASALGQPAGGTGRQVLEMLVMYQGLGVLMAVIAAFALGRLAVRSVRDVELAEAEAAAAQRPEPMATRPVDRDPDHDHDHDLDRDRELDRDRDRDDDERFRREPAPAPATAARPVATADTAAERRPARTDEDDAAPTTTMPDRSPQTTTGGPVTTARATGTDTTRVVPPSEPVTTGTRRSGGLLSRLRRS